MAAGRGQAAGRVGGGADLVAAGGEVDPQGAQQRSRRRRRAGCGLTRRADRQGDGHGEAAAGGVGRDEGAAHRLGEAAGDREAEAEAGAAAVVEALERLRRSARGRRRQAGAVVDDRAAAARRPATSPATRTGAAGWARRSARWRAGWRSPVRAGPGRPAPAAGRRARRARPRAWSGRCSTASATTASSATGRRSADSTPACSRLSDSRFSTRAIEPVGGLLDGGQQFGLIVSGSTSTSGWRRLDTAALIPASGVRRSWPTALSSAARSRSISASSRACAGLVGEALVLAQAGRGRGEPAQGAPVLAEHRRSPRGQSERRRDASTLSAGCTGWAGPDAATTIAVGLRRGPPRSSRRRPGPAPAAAAARRPRPGRR